MSVVRSAGSRRYYRTSAASRLPSLGLRREQQVAASFCASHKTLAFGMPLLATLFGGGRHPSLGLLTLPLLVVHPMQLLLGGLVVPAFRRYTGEYPDYASAVLVKGGNNPFENPSAYSDRTWAILRRGARGTAAA